jgi:hypothetical protein
MKKHLNTYSVCGLLKHCEFTGYYILFTIYGIVYATYNIDDDDVKGRNSSLKGREYQ